MKNYYSNAFLLTVNRATLLNEENGLLQTGKLVIECDFYHQVCRDELYFEVIREHTFIT